MKHIYTTLLLMILCSHVSACEPDLERILQTAISLEEILYDAPEAIITKENGKYYLDESFLQKHESGFIVD